LKTWGSGLIVLLGAASYGVLATFVKLGFIQGFSLGEITGSQMFFGTVLLWLIALTQYKKWSGISIKAFMFLLLAGALAGLTGIFYYASLHDLPASIAIILLFQFAWIGVLYEWMFDRNRPTKLTYISLALIMIGTVFAANIMYAGLDGLSLLGVFFGLLSAFTYAGFIYASGRVSAEVSPWLRSPLMVTGSFIITILIFPPTFFTSGVLVEGLTGIALALAIFGAVLPTICFTFGVPKIGVGMATILSSVELPVAVFMAWIVYSEPVLVLQWLGVSLILVAIALEKINKSIDMVFRK
jgi:drug/metabolite transporter (DMT)-like permease